MTIRIAWFSPLPPVRSGIATYSAELLPRLGPEFDVDCFIDCTCETGERSSWRTPTSGASVGGRRLAEALSSTTEPQAPVVFDAHDFGRKQQPAPYDLGVYPPGNAPCHDHRRA